MAIRLIDQYPNRAGVPNADYPHGVPRNKSTPTSTDGTPFEQAWFRDQEGFFQGLLETAGVTPSGSPDTVEQSDYLDALVSAMHGVVEVDVGGVGDVTLGIYPSRVAALRLTGTLGADVDLIVPDTERLYTIIDETTGSFSVTVRTELGTGVVIGESVSVVRSDGTNVVSANPAPDLGQNIAVFDTAGVTEWDVPEVLRQGLRKAHVTVVGGGAGGSRNAVSNRPGGNGGGAGGRSRGLLDLTAVETVSVTVGAGGAGGDINQGAGVSGGSSSFGGYMSATGGENFDTSGNVSGGVGTGGDINDSLGPGTVGWVSIDTSNAIGGNGGGPGGRGFGTGGEDAFGPGGGGGGAGSGSSSAGRGGDGIVIVRW